MKKRLFSIAALMALILVPALSQKSFYDFTVESIDGQQYSMADLKGKKVGMENGTTHQKYMQDKHPEINTVSYDSYQNAILELKNGRIDGVFGDTAVVNEWLKNNPQLASVFYSRYFNTAFRSSF